MMTFHKIMIEVFWGHGSETSQKIVFGGKQEEAVVKHLAQKIPMMLDYCGRQLVEK